MAMDIEEIPVVSDKITDILVISNEILNIAKCKKFAEEETPQILIIDTCKDHKKSKGKKKKPKRSSKNKISEKSSEAVDGSKVNEIETLAICTKFPGKRKAAIFDDEQYIRKQTIYDYDED